MEGSISSQELPRDLVDQLEAVVRAAGLHKTRHCELDLQAIFKEGRLQHGYVIVKQGPLNRSEIARLGTLLEP